MTQETNINPGEVSFKDFLFKDKQNKTILKYSAFIIIIQFGVFKYFYPYASYIHGDSFSYLYAAFDNLDINTYLVGYSKFLRLFSVFSNIDLALVAFQYFYIQCSALIFMFTLSYFNNFNKVIRFLFLTLIICNPLFLYLGNLVSSDCLFVALSLNWFSSLIWLINRPQNKIIAAHTVVLFIAFTFRYNALIYPIISIVTFGLSKLSFKNKLIGIIACLMPCSSFIAYTMYHYKKLTGQLQYSPFGGWQLANNAMYAYRYIDSAARKPVPTKFQALDNMVREYFDSTRDLKKYPHESLMASTVYMWDSTLPLFRYRDKLFINKHQVSELKKWASMGPFYKEYGLTIIKQYPIQFINYFIWPNANKYFAPPVEFLQYYNSGKDSVPLIAETWFRYNSKKIHPRLNNLRVYILDLYPIFSGIINVVFLCCLISFIWLKGYWRKDINKNEIILASTIWLINAAFTITASSAALRFQTFPILITSSFTLLLIDSIIKHANEGHSVSQKIVNNSLLVDGK